MPRITTEQAPSAKPISSSLELTTEWQTIIDVPDFDVPVVGFGIVRRIAPGIVEISSPILISNYSTTTQSNVDIRIIKADRPLVTSQTETDFEEWTSGSGYVDGEVITLTNGAEVQVNANVSGEISEFTVTLAGDPVSALPEPLEQASTEGGGTGFSITVNEDNLSNIVGHYYLSKEIPIRTQDTLVFPMNGQFLNTGDRLQIRAGDNDVLHATVSYTQGQAEEDDVFF